LISFVWEKVATGMLTVLTKQTLFIKSVSKDCGCSEKLHEDVFMKSRSLMNMIFNLQVELHSPNEIG